MNDDSDKLFDLGECDHKPMHPPREGMIGEHVFTEYWGNLMAQEGEFWDDCPNYQLKNILSCMPGDLLQRHATVAATFIRWLGTNCGRGFLDEAKRRDKQYGLHGNGYLAAWSIENSRRSWLNGGFRTIEHILAPDDCKAMNRLYMIGLIRQPELTVDDYEVVEHVVTWLGDSNGKHFVSVCEAEIKRRELAFRRGQLREFAKSTNNPLLLQHLDQEEANEKAT